MAEVTPVVASAEEAREKAKGLNFLSALAIPEIFEFPFPPFFIYLWQVITSALGEERKFPKFALGLPRGHAKTTWVKILLLFTIIFTKRRFILVVAASDEMAAAIISDVCDMLDGRNIVSLFGNWREYCERDRVGNKKFRFRGRDLILKGVGINSSFRGIQEKFRRPDVMVFDDAQSRECALSETQAQEFIEKFNGTALKTKAPNGCVYIYIGNMYRDMVLREEGAKKIYGCMLRNLQFNKAWTSIIVGGILADGTALWEDLQPLEQLKAELLDDIEAGTPESFMAEVMNDPKGGALKYFDFSRVLPYPYPEDFIPDGKFIMIDPSLGKKKSDGQSVILYYLIDGVPWCREIREIQKSAPDLVDDVIQWAIQEQVPLICAEDYAYQATLISWFQKWCELHGIQGLEFVGINRGKIAKNAYILSMFKDVMARKVNIHWDCSSQIFDQIAFFDPTTDKNRDDILDNLAYARQIAEEHGELAILPLYADFTENLGLPAVIDHGGMY